MRYEFTVTLSTAEESACSEIWCNMMDKNSLCFSKAYITTFPTRREYLSSLTLFLPRIEWVVVLPVWSQVYTEWEEGHFTVSGGARANMKRNSQRKHMCKSKCLGSSKKNQGNTNSIIFHRSKATSETPLIRGKVDQSLNL